MISRQVARLRSLWRGLRRRSDVEAEVAEEFRLHIEMRAEDLVRAGIPAAEALRRARAEFGNPERYKDEGRAARGLKLFDELAFSWLDVRLGARMMLKYPGLTAVGVFALAFAIFVGATGFETTKRAVFPRVSLVDRERVVAIGHRDLQANRTISVAGSDFERWRQEVTSIEALGAFRMDYRNLVTPDGRGEPAMLVEITPAAFALTGAPAHLGRSLVDGDERPDAPAVIVLGYDLWRTLGADPALIGRTLRLGGEEHTVVGVMPEDFRFPEHLFNAWLPLRLSATERSEARGSGLNVIGRLAAGVSLDEAQAELSLLGQRATAAFPATHANLRPQVRRFLRVVWDTEGQPASILSLNVALAALLMVIAGTLALPAFARALARETEIAVRTALGAGRRRIVMQLIAESLAMATLAAAIGLGAAELVLRWNFGFPHFGYFDGSGLTPKTVAYVGLLTALAAGMLGMIPALKVTRGLAARLKRATAGGGGFRFGGAWTVVVVLQVALTIAVPSALISTRREIEQVGALTTDAGIPTREYLIFHLEMDNEEPGLGDVPRDSARAAEYLARFDAAYAELERRLEAERGVTSVTFANQMPTRAHWVRRVELDGEGPSAAAGPVATVSAASVAVDFFRAMDAPILAGRGFDAVDVASDAPVVVVNESFVARVLGGKNAVGRRIRYAGEERQGSDAGPSPRDQRWYEIVGVVPDRAMGRADRPWAAGVYFAASPASVYPPIVAVRVAGEPAAMVPRIKTIAGAVDPGLRLDDPEHISGLSIVSLYDANYWNLRSPTLVHGLFMLVSLVTVALSLASIYAIMSFTAWQRTREIGLRVALGADAPRIIAVVFRRPLVQLGVGVLVGGLLIAGLWSKGFTAVSARGAAQLIGYALFMTAVCLLGTVVPIRRTLRVQPSVALKTET